MNGASRRVAQKPSGKSDCCSGPERPAKQQGTPAKNSNAWAWDVSVTPSTPLRVVSSAQSGGFLATRSDSSQPTHESGLAKSHGGTSWKVRRRRHHENSNQPVCRNGSGRVCAVRCRFRPEQTSHDRGRPLGREASRPALAFAGQPLGRLRTHHLLDGRKSRYFRHLDGAFQRRGAAASHHSPGQRLQPLVEPGKPEPTGFHFRPGRQAPDLHPFPGRRRGRATDPRANRRRLVRLGSGRPDVGLHDARLRRQKP